MCVSIWSEIFVSDAGLKITFQHSFRLFKKNCVSQGYCQQTLIIWYDIKCWNMSCFTLFSLAKINEFYLKIKILCMLWKMSSRIKVFVSHYNFNDYYGMTHLIITLEQTVVINHRNILNTLVWRNCEFACQYSVFNTIMTMLFLFAPPMSIILYLIP